MTENNSTRRSKRNRISAFDVSRISLQTVPKVRKINNKMSNPGQALPPSIIDMSENIITNRPNMNNMPSTSGNQGNPNTFPIPSRELDPLAAIVNESINETGINLRPIVREIISEEISKVNENIRQLSNMIQSMAMGSNQNSVNNANTNSNPRNPTPVSCIEESLLREIATRHNPTPESWQSSLQRGIRVDKFGFKFDGNPSGLSVEDFVFRLEHLQSQYQITWEEIYSDFHLLVSDMARNWYWLQIKSKMVTDWPSLKHALLNRFKTTRTDFEVMRDIVERKQLPGENTDKFFHEVNLMRSRLKQPIAEYELIKIVKRNLRENIAKYIYPMSISSMEHLRNECLEVEKVFPRRDSRVNVPITNRSLRVNEACIGLEEMEQTEDYNEMEEVAAFSNTMVCWNCKKPGHFFMDCQATERSLFCYRCGRPNTITPKCPNCRSGNYKKNAMEAGNRRSAEKTASTPTQTQ